MANTGVISPEDLAKKLAVSKKIMNKVDTGDYEKGNVNEGVLSKSPDELIESGIDSRQPVRHKSLGLPVGVPSVEKIRNSKLPDAIKAAMIENPIPVPEISLNEGIDMNIINKAKKLIEQENPSSAAKKGYPTAPRPQKQPEYNVQELETIIENVVRRVLDEKLTQILTAQHMSTINENLAIKVGDSIFTGKITKVKNSK